MLPYNINNAEATFDDLYPFIEREKNFYDTYKLVYSALVFGTLDNLNSEVLLLIIQSKRASM